MLFVPNVKLVNKLRMQKANTGSPSFVNTPRAMYFNSLISSLKKIGVNKDDLVFMCLEGKSFRKQLASYYKANRKDLRDKDSFVDWDYEFKQCNKLHAELKEATNWKWLQVFDGLEADDCIAIACRYFKDKEVIIVTGDADLKMLCYYEWVKYFNLNKKVNGSKGCFEKINDPLKILKDKATKGDKSDNIIPEPNETEEDINLRYKLVNLLELPEEIEQKGIMAIKNELSIQKEENLNALPEFKDCKQKFLKIYDEKYKVTQEYCYQLLEKRVERKKKEKVKNAKAT